VLLVSAGYYALAIVGTVLSVPPSGFAIVWPATAFLISVLLLTPPRLWWIYLLAVVPTHVHMVESFQEPHVPVLVVLTQIAGNFSLAVITALVVRATNGRPLRFDSFHEMINFILVAAIAVPAFVNALILFLHLQTALTTDFWLSWQQWMLASVFPTVTIPPLMILAFYGRLVGYETVSRKAYVELGLLAMGLFAVSIMVFGWEPWRPAYVPPLLLLPLPFLLWAAVRLGVGGTTLVLLAFAGAILSNALAERGPFAAYSPIENVLSLQVFLITISTPLLLLAALIDERKLTDEAMKQSEARMAVAAASTDTGLWQYEVLSGRMWATEHCRRMFSLETDAPLTPQAFLGPVHPDDRAAAVSAMEAAAAPGEPTLRREFRIVRPSGQLRWFVAMAHTNFDPQGVPIRVSGVIRDVTRRRIAERDATQLSERLLALQEEERQRIAAELHDSTAQHLVAIGLNLMSLRARCAADGEKLGLLDEIESSLEETTKEVRTFTYLLHPPHLESDGLWATLKRYVDGFGRRGGLDVTFRSSRGAEGLTLILPLQRSILRIVQEALTNVHRHADAKRVSVNIKYVGGHLHVVISDDGRGVEWGGGLRNGQWCNRGVGIPGMTARIRQFGGKLDIRSGPKGTTVHAAVPVE
jgi:signal transduction histidine kinase